MDCRERECVVDIETGRTMSEGVEGPGPATLLDVKPRNMILSNVCAGKFEDSNKGENGVTLSSSATNSSAGKFDDSYKGENGVTLSSSATNSSEILPVKIDRAQSENLMEKRIEDREKRKSTSAKKPPKPPRPPRGLSLDAADQKLIKEIHELAMLKRARIERMKALKKMKAAKASSVPSASNGSFFAMFFTVLFFIVLIFQGMSSRNSSSSFHSSPESGVAGESSLVFLQDHSNLSSSPSAATGPGSPNIVEQSSGMDSEYQVKMAIG